MCPPPANCFPVGRNPIGRLQCPVCETGIPLGQHRLQIAHPICLVPDKGTHRDELDAAVTDNDRAVCRHSVRLAILVSRQDTKIDEAFRGRPAKRAIVVVRIVVGVEPDNGRVIRGNAVRPATQGASPLAQPDHSFRFRPTKCLRRIRPNNDGAIGRNTKSLAQLVGLIDPSQTHHPGALGPAKGLIDIEPVIRIRILSVAIANDDETVCRNARGEADDAAGEKAEIDCLQSRTCFAVRVGAFIFPHCLRSRGGGFPNRSYAPVSAIVCRHPGCLAHDRAAIR